MTREEKIWELVDKYWKEAEMCRSDLFDFAKEIIAIDEWISVERKLDDDKYDYAMIESQYNKRKKEMIMDIKRIWPHVDTEAVVITKDGAKFNGIFGVDESVGLYFEDGFGVPVELSNIQMYYILPTPPKGE